MDQRKADISYWGTQRSMSEHYLKEENALQGKYESRASEAWKARL